MEAKRFPARKHRGRDGKGLLVYRESECMVSFEAGGKKGWGGLPGWMDGGNGFRGYAIGA